MSNSLKDTENVLEIDPMLARHRKKWRLAFNISRAVSQARKIVSKNQDKFLNKFSPSSAYTVVDIEPECLSSINKLKLSELVRDKNTSHLHQFGGVQGLIAALECHADEGIQTDTKGISHRRKAFGTNMIQEPSLKVSQVLQNLKDPIIAVLLLCALLSLGFGLKNEGLTGVSDGLSILFSICIVVVVTSSCNIWVARQFHRISIAKNNVSTDVIREGIRQGIPIFEVVVGDVVFLQAGDQVPADGLYIDGNSLQVNESELVKEANFDITSCIDFYSPFLLAGSIVTGGSARMLITAVGMNTRLGEMVSLTNYSNHTTRLQKKLHKLTRCIAKVGLAVAFLVLVVLLIRYFTGHLQDDNGKMHPKSGNIGKALIGIVTTPIVIATTTIPEGLLLAVTVTLAYSIKRMTADQATVRNLSSCEALGRITVICTDKSGGITLNSPQVNQFWLGVKKYSKSGPWSLISKEVLQIMHEGIGLNSATYESSFEFTDTQAEEAVNSWGIQQLGLNVKQLKENCRVLNEENFNLQEKLGSVFLQRNMDNKIHVHMRGSPDKILTKCSHFYVENGERRDMGDNDKATFEGIVQEMKDGAIHCIAYAHADVSREHGDECDDENFRPKQGDKDMTLVGILGLKDPCRPYTSKAMSECQKFGVNVKMLTTEDIPIARASAIECGILNPCQIATAEDVIDGTEFQNYTEEERLENVHKFSVLANASTSDKLLLIRCLKQNGHVVAVTQGSQEDEAVLKEADLIFSFGNQGTHGMKEKDIIILDTSFTAIAKALRWGRGIYNNIQMYTQFQLSATISSMIIDSVSTIFARQLPTINIATVITAGKVPLAAVQLLWVKLVVGTLVAVALTTDDPAENIMRPTIVDPKEPFITRIMWRNITVQALCQVIILLILQFKGETTFYLNAREKDTLIFNIFVLCQIFAIFNTLRGRNIFEGLKRKRRFWIIISTILVLQVLIVELLKKFAGTERLNWRQWQACVGITILSSLIGWLLKKIPVPGK